MSTVVVSGVHSGPSPSAGLGVARCLREAIKDIDLIGVDYSQESTGLEWVDFNRIAVPGQWDKLDLAEYADTIQALLNEGYIWISCLDLECRWLAETIGAHPNCCSPRTTAMASVDKPADRLAAALGIGVPDYIHLTAADEPLFDFLVHHNCRAWVKGPYYGAIAVASWPQFRTAAETMQTLCSMPSRVFLQREVLGQHYSITFAAWNGVLLDALAITKESTTLEGKTWTGSVEVLPPRLKSSLADFCQTVSWCGGGEIECIRDDQDQLWLMECNPRFPAWIYGAALAGHNLPAALVAAASGNTFCQSTSRSTRFTRVVLEIPATDSGRALPVEARIHGLTTGKSNDDLTAIHPSGMAVLAKRLVRDQETEGTPAPDDSIVTALRNQIELSDDTPTPIRMFLTDIANRQFGMVAARVNELGDAKPLITFAYSIKTNPDRRLLDAAVRHGLWGEAISQMEVTRALACGWTPDHLILNGPGKWWPSIVLHDPVAAVFCDSVEELKRVISMDRVVARILGIRIRPTNLTSRFGVALPDHAAIKELGMVLAAVPSQYELGLHFHLAGIHIGSLNWLTLVASLMNTAEMLRDVCGRRVALLDFGGGLTPGMFHGLLTSEYLSKLQSEARQGEFSQLVLEPGRALAQPAMALVTRILDRRKDAMGNEEVVVDASIAELPDINSFPHKIFASANGGHFKPLGRGRSKIFGRLCMESDVLAKNVSFPGNLDVGDILCVMDAGAYDASMSLNFGRGVSPSEFL